MEMVLLRSDTETTSRHGCDGDSRLAYLRGEVGRTTLTAGSNIPWAEVKGEKELGRSI